MVTGAGKRGVLKIRKLFTAKTQGALGNIKLTPCAPRALAVNFGISMTTTTLPPTTSPVYSPLFHCSAHPLLISLITIRDHPAFAYSSLVDIK